MYAILTTSFKWFRARQQLQIYWTAALVMSFRVSVIWNIKYSLFRISCNAQNKTNTRHKKASFCLENVQQSIVLLASYYPCLIDTHYCLNSNQDFTLLCQFGWCQTKYRLESSKTAAVELNLCEAALIHRKLWGFLAIFDWKKEWSRGVLEHMAMEQHRTKSSVDSEVSPSPYSCVHWWQSSEWVVKPHDQEMTRSCLNVWTSNHMFIQWSRGVQVVEMMNK